MGRDNPSAWLTDNADVLPRGGRALDVASGRGRHALWLAAAGFDVTAVDRNADAMSRLRAVAAGMQLAVDARVVDLETDPPPSLGTAQFDVVVGFHYLHRPLMPIIKDAVKPGGLIVYETFTTHQAGRGHPKNPAFLLRDGELLALMEPFTILRSREGDIDGRCIASVVARRG